MRFKFDHFGHVDDPVLTLCNPGTTLALSGILSPKPLGILFGCEAVEIKFSFNSPWELNFRVNKHYIAADDYPLRDDQESEDSNNRS